MLNQNIIQSGLTQNAQVVRLIKPKDSCSLHHWQLHQVNEGAAAAQPTSATPLPSQFF